MLSKERNKRIRGMLLIRLMLELAVLGLAAAGQHPVTTKIPPSYNGTTSWFAFEEAVEDWLDITELEEARRGPALKARLEGAAYMYRAVLDTLRPYFIMNKQSVFLYRFFQILKLHRGGQDINHWITRVEVVLDKAKTA
eukprot:3417686-Amphidinium_carterae.1